MARLGAIPANPLEWAVLQSGLAPTPLLDTMGALLLARTLMAATQVGLFEALADGPLAADGVALRCGTHPYATEKLLAALVGCGYLEGEAGEYSLAAIARRWLLPDTEHSLHDAVLHRYLDLTLMQHYEEFLRTGQPTAYHEQMTPEQWTLYQRGQRAHARIAAPEVVWRTPLPRGARTMLDIGGAHGYFSVALCRRHLKLRAVVLDLPEAIAHAAPLLAAEQMGSRVTHRAGDARQAELGSAEYDLIFVANLVHHFSAAENAELQQRIARALRPGGYSVVLDLLKGKEARRLGQIGALTDFYFAVTSRSGTWTAAEMRSWQRAAGLQPRPLRELLFAPGLGLQAACKPLH